MKRLLCFVLAFCMIAVFICGCANHSSNNTTQSTSDSASSSGTTESAGSTESSSSASATLEEPMKQPTSIPKSIKILAIGNSFSVDAVEYLWDMLDAAGVEEIVIGNL